MYTLSGFSGSSDLGEMRALIAALGSGSGAVDFEEKIQMAEVRPTVGLWRQDSVLQAFALVDPFNNLWFDCATDEVLNELGGELAAWGAAVIRKRNAESGSQDPLDFTCSAGDGARMRFANQNGFEPLDIRSLNYARSSERPLEHHPFPAGYTWRAVRGEEEVEALVALHRAAFGTDNMTVEERLAIMHAPDYQMEMDLVAVAPDGSLAAFCICGLEGTVERVGATDPIGVHPDHQGIGLAAALVTAGMEMLIRARAARIELGTSSENTAMQRLAQRLGFELVSEKVWFSKEVGN